MPKTIRIAQVGCGSLAQRGTLAHLACDDVKDRVQLVATMDVIADRAKACMEKFGAEEWYDDYDELLEKADIDAVTIASPIGLHYEQVMKAVEAGKHVHCNKTITTTVKEATDVIQAARKKDVKVVASPGGRAGSPIARRTRDLIREGILGKVYWAQAGMQFRGHEYEDFRVADDVSVSVDPTWYYKIGGGPMYDMGVYQLHLITSILGSARKVVARSGIGLKERIFKAKRITVEMDDNTLLLLDFGDSVFAFLFAAFAAGEGAATFYISGADGSARADYSSMEFWSTRIPEHHKIEKLDYKGTLRFVDQLGPAHHAWRLPTEERELLKKSLGLRALPMGENHVFNDVMHLVHCILNDEEPIVADNIESMQHARHVIEIIEKGYVAANTGRAQELTTTF